MGYELRIDVEGHTVYDPREIKGGNRRRLCVNWQIMDSLVI